jgi:FMN hydrolase / 5-amino-6-(5-phospho-D-ribitylamino)uracil phosphatase
LTIEAVLFDADQTLWDFQKVMHDALVAVLQELRLARPGTAAETLRVRDLSADRNDVALELEGVEYNLARLRQLGFTRTLQRLGGAGSGWSEEEDTELADRLTATYFLRRDRDPALFADTKPGLEALRARYRLGVVSNGSRLPDSVGLAGFFEVVVFAQDHRVAKPDPGIFVVAEQQLGLAPHACVLVGDHPLNDIVGAKQAGWRAIWIDRSGGGTYTSPEGHAHEPDAVISSLAQLPEVLAGL